MLRQAHVLLAYITVVGFVARFLLGVAGSRWRQHRVVRVAPHVLDTFLLALGVTMALRLGLSPVDSWLGAKLCGLLAYIGFGVLAMRARGPLRWVGAAGALASVGYVFAVAYSRQVWPIG